MMRLFVIKKDAVMKLKDAVVKHHHWRSRCFNLIASENVMSPLARAMMATDLEHRYANYELEDPSRRKYQGNRFIREVELEAIRLAKALFQAGFAEIRPISGSIADLSVILACTKKGGLVLELEGRHGGHAAAARLAKCDLVDIRVGGLPFDVTEMNIPEDQAAAVIRRVSPDLVILGASNYLFPHPVKTLSDAAAEMDSIVSYDASHPFGLIAGGCFHDPFAEGAAAMMGSTHKTFAGPQGGIVVTREDGAVAERIRTALHPKLITNHHPHRAAALAVTLAEYLAFGDSYAQQVVKNAKALGQALYEEGFKVLCPEKGFTESHTLLVDVSGYSGGAIFAGRLEEGGIIVSKTSLPWDKEGAQSGIRVGVQEVTRLGMKSSDMVEISKQFRRIAKGESNMDAVSKDVAATMDGFQSVHYCFDKNADAYKFPSI